MGVVRFLRLILILKVPTEILKSELVENEKSCRGKIKGA